MNADEPDERLFQSRTRSRSLSQPEVRERLQAQVNERLRGAKHIREIVERLVAFQTG
jgi:hypothetical protein